MAQHHFLESVMNAHKKEKLRYFYFAVAVKLLQQTTKGGGGSRAATATRQSFVKSI